MSAETIASPVETEVSQASGRLSRAWTTFEQFLVRAGDWLNPILVKETRQALKSFQFTATFILLLIACWIVTMAGVAYIGPRIFYAAEGSTLMLWYYAILAFPLAVVVPYAAFRSLASEREDNTYDLLSITTLKPRQIITGKLGSSVIQMGVFFSAITPCLAFTYLLRGIDLPTIAFLVAYLFFWSLALSMIGILVATLTKRRFAHVFLSVAFLGALLWLFSVGIIGLSIPMIQMSYSFLGSSDFWIFVLMAATIYTTTFALAYFAAAGMISFTSENRSAPLRICMLVQMATIVGWMGYGWIDSPDGLFAILWLAAVGGSYWYLMGTMLTAERPGMSQRVKRRLPHSLLGRTFFSWFNPGPGSGYMFVVANVTAVAILCWLAASIAVNTGRIVPGSPDLHDLIYMLIIGWSYLVAYLGIGLLVIGALRKFAVVTMLACVLIHFLLVLGGFGIPYAIKSMSVALRDADYSFLQITDPFFSLYHVAEGNTPADTLKLLVIIPSVAICVLLANLPNVIRELRVVREAAPKRVIEDEAVLNPSPEALPTNPWDAEKGES